MWKKILLVFLLIGILFPFAALSQVSESYSRIFNAIFETLLSHILMHGALYAALSWLVLILFKPATWKNRIFLCAGSVLSVGIVQEVIQAASVQNLRVGDTLFDLCVDVTFSLIPPIISILIDRRKKSDLQTLN